MTELSDDDLLIDPQLVEGLDPSGGGGRVRVVICDGHALFRRGLLTVLERAPDIEIVGEAAEADEAAALVSELTPDVVLVDLHLPGASAPETVGRVVASVPPCRVVLLTLDHTEEDEAEQELIVGALAAGAVGHRSKHQALAEAVDLVRAVAGGRPVLDPRTVSRLLPAVDGAGPGRGLSALERDVTRLVVAGRANAEIAEEIDVPLRTVDNAVLNVLGKVQLRHRVEALLDEQPIGG